MKLVGCESLREKEMTAVKEALKTHFGFEKFRSQQQEHIVKAVIKGKLFKKYFCFKEYFCFGS